MHATCSFFFFLYTRDVSVSDNVVDILVNGRAFFLSLPPLIADDEDDEDDEDEEEALPTGAMKRGEEEVRFRAREGVGDKAAEAAEAASSSSAVWASRCALFLRLSSSMSVTLRPAEIDAWNLDAPIVILDVFVKAIVWNR